MRNERLQHIDALRAIAALLVVFMHVSESFYSLGAETQASRWLYDVAYRWDFGRIGVAAFFVISGFVIPFSARPDRPHAGWDFAIKRLFRIYPAYWLSVPFGAYACYWLWGREFSIRDLAINFTLLQDIAGVPPAIGLYWTLLVEMAFYAICLVFLVTGNIRNYTRIAFFSGSLALAVLIWMIAHARGHDLFSLNAALWLIHLSIMSLGTLYRAWYDGELESGLARTILIGLLVFYLVGLPLVSTYYVGFPTRYTVPYSIGVFIFMLGASVIRIRNPFMTWLGQISYSIYLFHPIVFYPMLWILAQMPGDSWWKAQHLAFYLVLNTVITIIVAALVYTCVERPCIRIGRRVASAVTNRGKSTEPATT